jgi:hypothetical protein
MAIISELQELVDTPNETLDVEYKSWLDLNANEPRADLARHMAAMANHGGGMIVFGFTDDGLRFAGADPHNIKFTRDLIAGIVKRYLEPPFQCDVEIVRSTADNAHPIIVVPPHGAAPICAKAGGPAVNGKPQGITQGIYYARKPGPASEPIVTALEWAPIIRRCAMHERAAIIGALDAALRGSGGPSPEKPDELKAWHDSARSAFLRAAAAHESAVPRTKHHFQFSYAIDRGDSQRLPVVQLGEILRQVNSEVHKRMPPSGWTMFRASGRDDAQTLFIQDATTGQGHNEFLESNLFRDIDTTPREGADDLWRVATDGKATLIRSYREDRPEFNKDSGKQPTTWLSPNVMATLLVEFICHAGMMAERFNIPVTVSFRCEWHGLAGRHFHHPGRDWGEYRRARGGEQSDHRLISRSWPIGTLISGWDEIGRELIGPLMRVFAPDLEITSDWIKMQAPNWRD